MPGGGPVSLHIINTSSSTQTINISALKLDSVTYAPQNVLTNICSEDPYHYGFNGKYKDNEFAGTGNHIDYGARALDTRMARWINRDPMSLKYPAFSPYNYALNSPMLFSDKEGKEIYIADINSGGRGTIERVKYVKGQPYTGKSEYIRMVTNNLNQLSSESKVVGGIITTLVDQKEQIHQIQNFDPKYPLGRNWKSENGTITSYDPTSTDNGKDGKTTPTASLAHELKHGYDRALSQLRKEYFKYEDGSKPTFILGEWDAVNVENQVLSDEGQPLRSSYNGIVIPEGEFCAPLSNDKPIVVTPPKVEEGATISVILGNGQTTTTTQSKDGTITTTTVKKPENKPEDKKQ